MRFSWKAIMAGTAASVGALVLGATALTGAVSVQAPDPQLAPRATLLPVTKPAPPNRFFGSVAIELGKPGSKVKAFIGATMCGEGTITKESTYSIDVVSASTTPGCGRDEALVQFEVNGRPATTSPKLPTWVQGAFTEINLRAP